MVQLFSFKDVVVGNFDKFFVARNTEDAKRIARVSLQNFPFRNDLDLYFHCFVNENTGVIENAGCEFICHVSDLFDIRGDVNESFES